MLVRPLSKATQFDNPPVRRGMIEGVDVLEADIIRPPIHSIDDGIGLPRELVVQPRLNQTSDDWRALVRGIDDKVIEGAVQSSFGQGAMHGLDDIAS